MSSGGNKTVTTPTKAIDSSAKERIGDVDASDKKRRKAIGTGGIGDVVTKVTATATSVAPPLASAGVAHTKSDDVYATTVRSEELESLSRATDVDSDLFHHCASDFRSMLADILTLKLKGAGSAGAASSDKLRAELADKGADGAYQLVVMKKLNRMDKIRMRGGRDALQKEKLAVDNNHLQLQNLLYEAEHLRKEVQRCFQFKSQDADIELVPVEQFYAEAPPDVARPEQTRADEHSRRLARLEWELQQRKQLAAMCKELQLQKELAAGQITAKTERLESLAPRLEALLRATRPLQEALAMPVEDAWKVNRVARLLPPPLYMAYANLSAYAEACDVLLVARINGDESDVLDDIEEDDDTGLEAGDDIGACDGPLVDSDATATATVNDPFDEMLESDGEEQQQRARHHHSHHRDHRRQSQTVAAEATTSSTPTTTSTSSSNANTNGAQRTDEAQLERLFRAHPLSVSFEVRPRGRGKSGTATTASLTVTLRYLSALNLIAVTCSTAAGVAGVSSDEPMLAPSSLLNALTAGDTGEDSPNPRTHYQLRSVHVDPQRFGALLAGKRLGVAYRWAQQMCGLDVASVTAAGFSAVTGGGDATPSLELTQSAVPQVVRQIRQRWQTRLQLCEQVRTLSGEVVVMGSASAPAAAQLVRWQSIGWPEYSAAPAVQRFIEAGHGAGRGIVGKHDMFYAVKVARGGRSATPARFECAVRVSVQHPHTLPLWALTLHGCRASSATAQTNAIVREIECWINAATAADGDENVLATQLQRARASLDIYVETTDGDVEQREKTFLRAFRCRTRSRPLRPIVTPNGSFIYTQL